MARAAARPRQLEDGSEQDGEKGSTTRGGMHVPLIASWPGKIEARHRLPRPGGHDRFPAHDLRSGGRRRPEER